ncbi:hypothetical protein B2J93_5506 [Marssonina coronariae]|uniref:Uncharacterized protein n=1 Tax=Diplocarpon coronariae TaxID=2795749 RepID=A0A218Z1V9_9HELO|nr:hypothetical protein B2J93_5506 [Marssonina coronariae]
MHPGPAANCLGAGFTGTQLHQARGAKIKMTGRRRFLRLEAAPTAGRDESGRRLWRPQQLASAGQGPRACRSRDSRGARPGGRAGLPVVRWTAEVWPAPVPVPPRLRITRPLASAEPVPVSPARGPGRQPARDPAAGGRYGAVLSRPLLDLSAVDGRDRRALSRSSHGAVCTLLRTRCGLSSPHSSRSIRESVAQIAQEGCQNIPEVPARTAPGAATRSSPRRSVSGRIPASHDDHNLDSSSPLNPPCRACTPARMILGSAALTLLFGYLGNASSMRDSRGPGPRERRRDMEISRGAPLAQARARHEIADPPPSTTGDRRVSHGTSVPTATTPGRHPPPDER